MAVPGRHLLAEGGREARRAGAAVDQHPARGPGEQDGLPLADVEQDHRGRMGRPRHHLAAGDRQGDAGGQGESEQPPRPGGPERDQESRQARVVAGSKPGREGGDGNGGGGDRRQRHGHLLEVGKQGRERDGERGAQFREGGKRCQQEARADHRRQERQHQRVREWGHRREDVKAGGGQGQSADLGGQRHRERFAEQARQPLQAGADARGQEHDRRRPQEGELEAHVPGELGVPAEHDGADNRQRGPDVGGAPEPAREQGQRAHRRRSHRRRGGPSGQRVEPDQADQRNGRPAAKEGRQCRRREPGEDGHLEPAQHQEVDEPGCLEGGLEPERDAGSDPEHDPEKDGGVGLGKKGLDRGAVGAAQLGRQPGGRPGGGQRGDAGCRQLEQHLPLGQVGPPIEARPLVRQAQAAGHLEVVAVFRHGGAAGAEEQVAGGPKDPAADASHRSRGEQELVAAGHRAGIVDGGGADDHRPARERGGPRSQAGIGGRQLGPSDPRQRRSQGEEDGDRPRDDGQPRRRQGEGQSGRADQRPAGQGEDSQRDSGAPGPADRQ